MGLVEPAHRGLGNGVLAQTALQDERAEDERNGRGGVLATDGEQEIPLLCREEPPVAAIPARHRAERVQAATTYVRISTHAIRISTHAIRIAEQDLSAFLCNRRSRET